MKVGWLLVLCMLVLCLVGQSVQAAPATWVTNSMVRVKQTAAVPGATHVSVAMAKGEYESFQIIVQGPATVTSVAPVNTVSGLSYSIFYERFVRVTTGSGDWATNVNKPLGPGMYPDILVPFSASMTAASGVSLPFWVDIYAGSTTQPGDYTIEFLVTTTTGNASVFVDLRVWNFALPTIPSEKSSFLVWVRRADYQLNRLLIKEHKIMPIPVAAANAAEFMSYGLNAVNVGFWSGADGTNCTITNPIPTSSSVLSAISAYPASLYKYAYVSDEVGHCTGLDQQLATWTAALRANGVDVLITTPPRPGWEFVDVYVELGKQYDAAAVNQAIATGHSVWSYNCLQQDDYTPKWLMDYAPINFRIQPGFINQQFGMTGLLYWRVDYWSSDPLNNIEGYASYFPGEGMLVYPGESIGYQGVLPSMRLKYLRDGIEDYDYIQLAKGTSAQAIADAAVDLVAPNWRDWTRDTSLLEAQRRLIGEALSGPVVPPVTPPVANFTGNPTTGVVPLTVLFTDTSTNTPTSWAWAFGDGSTSVTRNPSHQYTSVGSYTVTLTATNVGGSDSETKANYIVVNNIPAPVAGFVGAPLSGIAPLTVSFADLSTGNPTSWVWSFGDGGVATVRNPSYQYVNAGVYTVDLTAYNAGGADTETKVGYVVVSSQPKPPVANFTGTPTTGTVPLSVIFTDLSTNIPTSWSWVFGDGSTSNQKNPTHVYGLAGTYTVSLTVANADGSATTTKTDYITALVPLPHVLAVKAFVDPSAVYGYRNRRVIVWAQVTDSRGHAVTSVKWTDGGFGGIFTPTGLLTANYRLPRLAFSQDLAIPIKVTVVCSGGLSASDTVLLTSYTKIRR